jgi:transposase IS3/IS911 family protein
VQSQNPQKSVKLKEAAMEGIAMKHYSKEFKEEALKLSDEIGVKKAAQQLGIAYYTLADWRSIRRNTPPAKTLSAEEQTIRIRELEREVSELRTANDILKDALGFFAKDRKK